MSIPANNMGHYGLPPGHEPAIDRETFATESRAALLADFTAILRKLSPEDRGDLFEFCDLIEGAGEEPITDFIHDAIAIIDAEPAQ